MMGILRAVSGLGDPTIEIVQVRTSTRRSYIHTYDAIDNRAKDNSF